MNRIEFRVDGMVCEGCSGAVRKAVTALAGVAGANVDHRTGAATVNHDAAVEPDAIYTAIRDAGFGVSTCGNPACGCRNCRCAPCRCH